MDMNATRKTYIADSDLAVILKDAAQAGTSVFVRIGDETYLVRVEPVQSRASSDIWESYDPEHVRQAIRRSAAMGTSTAPSDLDALIAAIRDQRGQASDAALS